MNTTYGLPLSSPSCRIKALTAGVLSIWFLLALTGSLLGVFNSRTGPPILLGAAAILPVVAFVIGYLRWPAFRETILAADLRVVTLAHTFRVGGVAFLVLYHQGILPAVFALPAGWGDIAIGVTAPLIAWTISSRKSLPKPVYLLWNGLGLLDLVTAVTLGVLASRSSIRLLAGGVTTEVMGQFPMSLIPTFFVPVLLICHITALILLRRPKKF